VTAEKPNVPKVSVTKLECTGHVQKRIETRLRILVKNKSGRKLHDGKTLVGNGCLTKSETDKLQNYYGIAIRMIVKKLEAMKKPVWVTHFHKLSTDDNPNRGLCLSDKDSVNSRTVPVNGSI
jgi:hypothetical protein